MLGSCYLISIFTLQYSLFILYLFRSFETVSHLALWTKGHSERMLRLLWGHQCCRTQIAEAEGTTLSSHTLLVTCLLSLISFYLVKKCHCFLIQFLPCHIYPKMRICGISILFLCFCAPQGALERVEDGESRLMEVCQEGEKLLLHLPKASSGQVQQSLSCIQQDWDSYVEQCRLSQQSLEESASLLSR